MPYGDINAIKVQLANRIMRMDESEDVLFVLNSSRTKSGRIMNLNLIRNGTEVCPWKISVFDVKAN